MVLSSVVGLIKIIARWMLKFAHHSAPLGFEILLNSLYVK